MMIAQFPTKNDIAVRLKEYNLLEYRGVPNMTASKWPKLDRYEWDARFTAETDMSETLEPEFEVQTLNQSLISF